MGSKKKIAVVLAGCGVYDGAEIHEAVLTMLAIARAGADYKCFAPDKEQVQVINHITGEEVNEKRNVMVESARISRGVIESTDKLDVKEFDAVIFPGGFGVAKNLSTLAFKGADCEIDPDIKAIVQSAVKNEVAIGALCIAPAMIARILPGADVTIGNDQATAGTIAKMGGSHHVTDHGEVIVDDKYKLVTSPCYMLDATIDQIAEGAENVVKKLLSL